MPASQVEPRSRHQAPRPTGQPWLSAAARIARKDLLIERRSHVVTAQIIPFAGIVLLLFAFALDPDRGILRRVAPGLFWVAVLLCTLLMVARSYAIEPQDGLVRIGYEPPAIFFGKTAAVFVQLLALELMLGLGMVALYDVKIHQFGMILFSLLLTTLALAALGVMFGAVSSAESTGATLLPILLFPALTPVLIGGTQSLERALQDSPADAWPWIQLLGLVAAIAVSGGALAYEWLVER